MNLHVLVLCTLVLICIYWWILMFFGLFVSRTAYFFNTSSCKIRAKLYFNFIHVYFYNHVKCKFILENLCFTINTEKKYIIPCNTILFFHQIHFWTIIQNFNLLILLNIYFFIIIIIWKIIFVFKTDYIKKTKFTKLTSYTNLISDPKPKNNIDNG